MSILCERERIIGPLRTSRYLDLSPMDPIQEITEDREVNAAINFMGISEVFPCSEMQQILCGLLLDRQEILKFLGKIVGIQQNISVKSNVEPIMP